MYAARQETRNPGSKLPGCCMFLPPARKWKRPHVWAKKPTTWAGQAQAAERGKKKNKHTGVGGVLPQSNYKKDTLQPCVPESLLVSASSLQSQTHLCVYLCVPYEGRSQLLSIIFQIHRPSTGVQVATARQKRCARPHKKHTHTQRQERTGAEGPAS